MDIKKIKTLGELKAAGYKPKRIKDEVRNNLINKIGKSEPVFKGIMGFEDTVIPDIERALLSRHNILFLGLRGQAKTRIARSITGLLDEFIPIISGSELNDDPMQPLSRYGIDKVTELGDKTPIEWVAAADRYVEKLATPDVSISDLIGDVDPIKAATLKLPYSDERVIHFGLVPRAHRSVFVINELPDLQARIQVSLFNILQEGDLQIRGFKLRLPLDILFIFTANPEDYTNRGSIVTPLKDRIESQILTHYPTDIDIAKTITSQEARITDDQSKNVEIPEAAKTLLEMTAFEARNSELIDEKSGVSARLSISAMENLVSAAERRMIINKEKKTSIRIADFWGIIPSITGKVELVYEGEQEGPYNVALRLMNDAIKKLFLEYFPNPDKIKAEQGDPYGAIKAFFGDGNSITLLNDLSDKKFSAQLDKVPGLKKLVQARMDSNVTPQFLKELVLHGLSAFEFISKEVINADLIFRDPIADMFDDIDNLSNLN